MSLSEHSFQIRYKGTAYFSNLQIKFVFFRLLCCITCFCGLFAEIIVANRVTDAERVFEQRGGGIKTLAGYLRDRAVEFHLPVNLVARTPLDGLFHGAKTIWCQTNVKFTSRWSLVVSR